MNYRSPEFRSALAAEYVLGSLRGRARRRFERLLAADFTLQREVERWQNDLYPTLLDALPDETPPARVWENLQQRTEKTTAVPPAGAPPRVPPPRQRWWQRAGLWQTWSALATAAALALAVTVAVRPTATAPVYMVVISDDAEARASWVVSSRPGSDRFKIKNLRPQDLPAGRDFQLWAKLEGQPRVRPVGLIPASGEAELALPANLIGQLDQIEKFGVSVEPEGGSPTGQPTTTPLYHGPLLSL